MAQRVFEAFVPSWQDGRKKGDGAQALIYWLGCAEIQLEQPQKGQEDESAAGWGN